MRKSNQHKFNYLKVRRNVEAKRPDITSNDVQELSTLIQSRCKWPSGLRDFQLQALASLGTGRDVIVHAGTGCGKTAIFAGLHLLPDTAGMFSLLISPLIALQNEQVKTFDTDFGLKAIAINSSQDGCTDDALAGVIRGEYQIVLLSPEMLQATRFSRKILHRADIMQKLLLLGVDEAHCISYWGDSFRKQYSTIGSVRPFMPKGAPIVAVSATMPLRVQADVAKTLRLDSDTLVLDVGNTRRDLTLICVRIQHPLNSFRDLEFVVPKDYKTPKDIPKIIIYYDNIKASVSMFDYLTSLLRPEHRKLGLIRPFNATHTHEYREAATASFKAGDIRILMPTDIFGMGCNVGDADGVIQWKLPSSISSFVQRAGRAARSAGMTGRAILMAEPSAYPSAKKSKGSEGAAEEPIVRMKITKKELTEDANFLPLIDQSPNAKCRRRVIARIYNCDKGDMSSNPPELPCCDVCKPDLRGQIHPNANTKGKRKKNPNAQKRIVRGVVHAEVQNDLYQWRKRIRSKHHQSSLCSASVILPDAYIDTIACIGPIETIDVLKRVLEGWFFWDKYGLELWEYISTTVDFPPFEALPKDLKKKNGKKRSLDEVDQGSQPTETLADVEAPTPSASSASKRARTETTQAARSEACWSAPPPLPTQYAPGSSSYPAAFATPARNYYQPASYASYPTPSSSSYRSQSSYSQYSQTQSLQSWGTQPIKPLYVGAPVSSAVPSPFTGTAAMYSPAQGVRTAPTQSRAQDPYHQFVATHPGGIMVPATPLTPAAQLPKPQMTQLQTPRPTPNRSAPVIRFRGGQVVGISQSQP